MSSEKLKSWSPETESNLKFRTRVAFVLTATIFVGGYFLFPCQLPSMKTDIERIVFTLKWEMFSAMTLIMGMMGVMGRRRGTVAADPIGGNSEHFLLTQKNILQNTVEQFAIHFIGQLLLAVYLSPDNMKVIPILVVLFVSGRIIYKVGYEMDPMRRSTGFIMTFLPIMATYVFCTYCFVREFIL